MCLPGSFPISASQINVELGRAATAAFDIQGTEERTLAQVPSGAISMSDFLGKCKFSVTAGSPATVGGSGSSATFNGVDFGPENSGRKLIVQGHAHIGSGAATQFFSASATIGGVPATVHVFKGDRNANTSAAYMAFIASADVPTGTSGTVSISWTGGNPNATATIAVVKAIGLAGVSPTDAENTNCNGCFNTSLNLNVPANGVVIAAATAEANTGPITMGIGQDYNSTHYAGKALSGQSANASFSISAQWGGGFDPSGDIVAVSWVGQ